MTGCAGNPARSPGQGIFVDRGGKQRLNGQAAGPASGVDAHHPHAMDGAPGPLRVLKIGPGKL